MNEKTLKLLAGMYTFYEKELTPFSIEVWSEALSGFDEVDLSAAFSLHLRDHDRGRFLPKPADIIRHAEGTADEAALMAWAEVIGSYRAPNEAAKKAVEALGGFVAIRRAPEAENHFLQRRFVEFFKAYRHREKQDTMLRLSTAEQSNVSKITHLASTAVKRQV